jgi:hypothetical protein
VKLVRQLSPPGRAPAAFSAVSITTCRLTQLVSGDRTHDMLKPENHYPTPHSPHFGYTRAATRVFTLAALPSRPGDAGRTRVGRTLRYRGGYCAGTIVDAEH